MVGLVLYVVVGAIVGVIAARRWIDVHPVHPDSYFADYATAGFFAVCAGAVWPGIVLFVGLGLLVTVGRN